MTNEILTSKELKSVESLIKLGDSKELAIKTILELRHEPNNTAFYKQAYEI